MYDRTYTYSLDKSGHAFLQGDSSSLIYHDTTLSAWLLWSIHTQNRVATSQAGEHSLMAGEVTFDFRDVSGDLCGTGDGNPEHVFKLTTCLDTMFTCDDGRCISMEARCDDTADCIDGSDEDLCDMVAMSKKYLKGVPPFIMDTEWRNKIPVDVKTSVSVQDILRYWIFLLQCRFFIYSWYQPSIPACTF